MAFLALVFGAELAAGAAIGVGVHHLSGGGWAGALAGAAAAALAILAWGCWAAPRAVAPPALALATKVVVFGSGVALLALSGYAAWALVLAALVLVAHLGAHLGKTRTA